MGTSFPPFRALFGAIRTLITLEDGIMAYTCLLWWFTATMFCSNLFTPEKMAPKNFKHGSDTDGTFNANNWHQSQAENSSRPKGLKLRCKIVWQQFLQF